MVQVPAVSSEIVVPLTLHTDGVVEASATGSPELAVAVALTEPLESN